MSNKDEALRAKDLAEDLMRKADFTTARRFATKAQKMDGTLENIAQMIIVCDVHCAASEKSRDWYKILQVEHNADEITIKKQYKKLALHLHPDKNKLPGAESAFKTIGEAQRALLDKGLRRIHDMRHKPFKRPAQAPETQHVFQTTGLRPEKQPKPPAQPTEFSGGQSFLSSCPFCHMKHEYVKESINKLMTCQRCSKQFFAQTASQGPPAQATFPFFQQNKVANQEADKAAEKKPGNTTRISPINEGTRAKTYSTSVENSNGKRKRKNIVESSNSSFEWVGVSQNSGACNAAKDSSSGSAPVFEIFKCAKPDFTNFEKSREETCFKAGQIWAMYDDMGQMPRYYAIIRKVIRKHSFMLKITWLEVRPDNEKAKQWVHKKLPISVGKFQLRRDGKTIKTPSFSHLIDCRVRDVQDTISVYPRLGETWALFKNWDINWSSSRRRYEYEFVEILSEYVEGVAIEVALLRKVKGFASVFCRITPGGGSDKFHIPTNEFLRFSHSIPSAKLTGKEGNGIPVGSYELDTAALPQKIEEEEEAIPVAREAANSKEVHHHSSPSSEPDCIVIPNFQFHDFSAERLEGKFAKGQIWSLKSEEDGLPKYYAQIQKVDWKPIFKLQISRLELKSLPENVRKWRDEEMPVTCGNFNLKKGHNETLTKVTSFSHQIKAQQQLRINEYNVIPKTGEIWAMYKNWSDTMTPVSLKKCAYEVVEVIDDNESYIEVMMLERVHGFISVFKEKVEGGVDVKKKIPRCELLRFSHFVRAFRLTGERDGALRGYVELDPTTLPRNLRRS